MLTTCVVKSSTVILKASLSEGVLIPNTISAHKHNDNLHFPVIRSSKPSFRGSLTFEDRFFEKRFYMSGISPNFLFLQGETGSIIMCIRHVMLRAGSEVEETVTWKLINTSAPKSVVSLLLRLVNSVMHYRPKNCIPPDSCGWEAQHLNKQPDVGWVVVYQIAEFASFRALYQ